MKNLLTFEFKRLRRQKSFFVFTAIMVGLALLSAVTTLLLIEEAPELAVFISGDGITTMVASVSNNSFTVLASIFAVLFACENHDQKTIKNIYAKGYSRQSAYIAKAISVFVSVSVMYFALVISSFVIGSLCFGVGKVESARFILVMLVQYICAMANTMFFFAIASVIRKGGASVACVFVAPMLIGIIISLIDVIIETVLEIEDFFISDYWVTSLLNSLSSLDVTDERLITCLLGSLIYIPAFFFLGLLFQKRIDL